MTTQDLASLVSIDIDAEIRKVTGAELHGPWQWPAEWARRAFAAGAKRVTLKRARGQLIIHDDGAGPPRAHLEQLARLLDPGAPALMRHEALSALEQSGQAALIALPGVGPAELTLDTPAGQLRWRRGQTPLLAGSGGGGVQLAVPFADVGGRQALAHLEQAARFIGQQGKIVEIDDRPIRGAAAAALHLRLAEPVTGFLAWPASEETGSVSLLVHGLVADHLAVTEPPFFDAVLEMPAVPRAELRARASLLWPALTARYVGLLAAHAARRDGDARARARLGRVLLQAARRADLRDLVERVRFLPAIVQVGAGAAPARTWLSLADLRARPEPRTLHVLSPDQNEERFALDATPTLLLGEADRALLADLGKWRLREPSRAPASDGVGALLGSLARGGARALGRLRPVHVLPDAALSAEERALLTALRPLVTPAGQEVQMSAGARSPRFVRERIHLLPRENPAVRDAVKAFARDPAWLYPAALALLEARPPAAEALASARERWLNGAGGG